MSDSDRIPLMFQAQIEGRGKIQYAGDAEPATKWIKQWLEGAPPVPDTAKDKNVPLWKQQATKPNIKLPEFGQGVEQKEYTVSWRLVTNSGQDEDVIRPVIGAKGLPFFPGSSMKGAFLRVCTPEKRSRYCGEVKNEAKITTKPGILRFHGGYPVDMTWADQEHLLDVVHSQQERQVMGTNGTTSAHVQISLYQCTFKFGLSSTQSLSQSEWDEIWKIWERALGKGLGSRVSAGYGRFEEVESSDKIILSVQLTGKGLTSQLLNKTPEFRPNMFKAVLRGHTLRLLGGVTDMNKAEELTKQLWGGFIGKDGAIVGQLGINFREDELELGEHIYNRTVKMSTYDLKLGTLEILSHSNPSPELKSFITYLVQFSLLLGGFGKSWRRVNHHLFYPDYLRGNNKPAIGCHWEFVEDSKELYLTALKLDNISKFLAASQSKVTKLLQLNNLVPSNTVTNWREVWHPQKVQVWGRIAENKEDSKAVHWFHGNYAGNQSIKESILTGKLNQIGRTWHRMYPRYVKNKLGELKQKGYVELLTIFPDDSPKTQSFLQFLNNQSEFTKLYPLEQ